MIIYRMWINEKGPRRLLYDGWFLFGIVPLYLRIRRLPV